MTNPIDYSHITAECAIVQVLKNRRDKASAERTTLKVSGELSTPEHTPFIP